MSDSLDKALKQFVESANPGAHPKLSAIAAQCARRPFEQLPRAQETAQRAGEMDLRGVAEMIISQQQEAQKSMDLASQAGEVIAGELGVAPAGAAAPEGAAAAGPGADGAPDAQAQSMITETLLREFASSPFVGGAPAMAGLPATEAADMPEPSVAEDPETAGQIAAGGPGAGEHPQPGAASQAQMAGESLRAGPAPLPGAAEATRASSSTTPPPYPGPQDPAQALGMSHAVAGMSSGSDPRLSGGPDPMGMGEVQETMGRQVGASHYATTPLNQGGSSQVQRLERKEGDSRGVDINLAKFVSPLSGGQPSQLSGAQQQQLGAESQHLNQSPSPRRGEAEAGGPAGASGPTGVSSYSTDAPPDAGAALAHDPVPQLDGISQKNAQQNQELSLLLTDPASPQARAMLQTISAPGLDAEPHRASTDGEANRARKPASPSGPGTEGIRRDFPILKRKVHGKPLIWFDNGATTQKPQQVIDALNDFYANYNSNIHRGAHALATEATDAYEGAREKVREFLGAEEKSEIIFVRGTTEGINLVAQSWGRANVGEGDEIILSHLEHHANIVPWQQLADEKGAKLKVIPVNDRGELMMDVYRDLFSPKTKIVAVTHASNTLGTITPLGELISIAHAHGVPVLADGAQSVAHMPVNVKDLDVDFYVFSGHKIFGPTGVGVVYGKREQLEAMPPWQGGGSMIKDVTFEQTIYNEIPEKFEAGTPVIGPAIGLGVALDYVLSIGRERLEQHERSLTEYATRRLNEVPGLRIIGNAADRIGVLSFVIDGFSPEVIGEELDRNGVAVRVGHHCAQPILRRFGLEQTVRSSLALYNTEYEVDFMVDVLRRLVASAIAN